MEHYEVSSLRAILDLLQEALKRLGVSLQSEDLERLCSFVQRHMDGRSRLYHGLRHVFDLAKDESPTFCIAAIYHDLVQLNVDHGYSPHVASRLEPYLEIKEGSRIVKNFDPIEHIYADYVIEIFGLKRGQKIPKGKGENEFLSALIAVVEIGQYLTAKEMIQVIASIEGTIPFRPSSDGKKIFDKQYENLVRLNDEKKLHMTNAEIKAIVSEAVSLANKDVVNFAERDIGYFIFNTWALFPETNIPMRFLRTISIQQFRTTLTSTVRFFGSLKPNTVFNQFNNTPDEMTYRSIIQNTETNLKMAKRYFEAIVYSVALVEAIAIKTGGEAPLSMFVGDMPEVGQSNFKQNHFFPRQNPASIEEKTLYALLQGGRVDESRYCMASFPLGAYVLGFLGIELIEELYPSAEELFLKKISPEDFLRLHSQEFLSDLVTHLSKMAITRKVLMLELVKKLKLAA